MRARRLVTHALPALALLLALAANAQLAALARLLLALLTRAASLALVLAGSGSVWWALRAWQLRQQQELLDQAWAKLRFLQRYRSSTGGSSSSAAAEQLPRSAKRLPLPAHLRTAWGLPPEVADELALVAQLAVRDYVGFWYQPLSPANDDFPADLRLLLADLLGALAARVLEIDSSQALAVAANAIEILRLHLGWFREAYAQLGEDFPAVFGDAGGDADDENLLRRQEYVAGFVQKSPFLHPGCAAPASSSSRKPARETPEVVYLRHVASQILVQLKPELGFQYDTSVFVSLVMNLMREATTFKILRPMAEYAQQRYANELVLASLQAYLGAKDTTAGPLSPIGHTAVGSLNALSSAATHSISGVGGMTLNKLRSTKSFLYKATKRSSEQAEAAFLAVVDAVHSTGPAAAAVAAGHADTGFDGDEWSDAPSYTLSDAAMSVTPPARAKHAVAAGAPERKQHFAAPFSLNDRLSIPRATRLKAPRAFLPGASGGLKTGGGGGVNGIDDLKNIKANIGSSLSKVKRRFRTLSGHPNDPDTPNAGGVGFPSTQAAARMMKKPGMLLQKALRRNDGPAMLSPLSPTNSLDEVLTPPPLSDDDFILGGDLSDPPSPSRADESMAIDELAVDTEVVAVEGDDDDEVEAAVQLEAERVSAAAAVRERAVELLEKATAGYVRMCQERPEMRSSARARELFEFLSAMEDVFLLGYTDGEEVEDMAIGMENSRRQQYWNYLAQDRPETPFLDDHRTFVASKCPACAESESFCSTRGVQWILVALEKGMLWKYVTALHLDQTLTERFYDQDESVFRSGRLMESVLKSLVQLNQISIALEIPSLLGRKDEMDEAFGVSASASKLSSSAAGVDSSSSSSSSNVVCVLESVWEVERYVPIQGWTRTQDKRWQELPSSEWIWEGEWTVAVNSSSDSALALEAAASNGDVWEYAKTFEDRFHEKEKKFDSVRRRKWVRRRRQLPCVLSAPSAPRKAAGPPPTPVQSPVLAAIPSSSSQAPKLPSSPPALFGVASLPVAPASTVITLGAAGKVRNVKQFFDLSKRGKAKTDDTAVASPSLPFSRKPLMKRRSSSFDKSMFASPIADLMLALESPKNVPLTPEKTAPPEEEKTKKKRRSIPSLRRSNTSSTKDTKVALGLVRSTTTGSTTAGDESTGRRSSLLDSDDDDDDKLCFRCFTPLHGDDESEDAVVAFTTCPSCQQRVCSTCLCHLAFLVFPPPLEVSTKAHVCGPCYDRLAGKYRVKVEAHVSKYFLRERDSSISDGDSSQLAAGDGSDTEASSANGRAAAAPRFEIVVFVKDKAAFAWSVVKTFQDFEALEKQLSEKLKKQEKKHGAGCRGCHWKGVDYTELLGVEPSLKKLPVAALAYDKRLYVLEQFVQSLLTTDTLCQSPPVQKFLGLSNAVSATSGVGSRPFSPTAAAAVRSSDVRGEYPGSPSAGAAEGAAASSTNSSSSGATGVVMMENGKWRKGKWVAPETSSNETKVRLLQKLEVSLFAVVGEMFEFDGIGVVRRQLFAMSRSFIKAFLSASHFRKLEKQYLSFTDPKKVAAAIVTFREYMFPDPDAPPPPVPPATLSAAEMQALRKDALDAILASFPSTLVSLFGETSCENAALKLHEFVQHEVFVKNLLFSVADEVLQQLFPDFVLFKSKQVVGSSANSSSVLPPK